MSHDLPVSEHGHAHEFTGLFWHFGQYGRQDVHVHDCFKDGCNVHLIGEGRTCSGQAADHHREMYRHEEWVAVEEEAHHAG